MYCGNCGNVVDGNASYCNHCGAKLNFVQQQKVSDDNSSIGFAILGFFIPIVGLILFLVYEDTKPKRAKSAGKGALIGFITGVVLSVISGILYFIFAASVFANILDYTYMHI